MSNNHISADLKKKKVNDPYGILPVIAKGRGDKYIVQNYAPFLENDVLLIKSTSKTIMALLRNGTVVTFGEESNTLGRRLIDTKMDSFIPCPLTIATKIIDIACGREHCIAKGVNYKIYTWGSNSYGQVS